MIAREEIGERTTDNDIQEGERGKMGQERRDVHVTGGTMKGRKEVRVDVTEGKLLTGKITARKVSREEAMKERKNR